MVMAAGFALFFCVEILSRTAGSVCLCHRGKRL